jgi:hypothetical protein
MSSSLPLWPSLSWPLRFSLLRVPRKMMASGDSSPCLSLPSRVCSLWCRRGVLSPHGSLPCGFLPFDVFPDGGSHSPRDPDPWFRYLLSVSHALEVLLRSHPAGLVSCRSRPWGFPSGSFSTRRAVHPLGCRTLLWLVRKPPLQGLAPCERPGLDPGTMAGEEPATLLGFASLGVSPFRPGLPEEPPLLSLTAGTPERTEPLLFRVCRPKGWLRLSRVCHPFRGFLTSSVARVFAR